MNQLIRVGKIHFFDFIFNWLIELESCNCKNANVVGLFVFFSVKTIYSCKASSQNSNDNQRGSFICFANEKPI